VPRSKKPEGKRTTARKRTTSPKSAKKAASQKPASDAVEMEKRSGEDRRKSEDRRKQDEPVAVERRKIQRRAKVNRRRQIDPTTCERDYTDEEITFMNALDEYKRASGRMFPTCSEILEVVKNLGYEKRPTLELPEQPENPERLTEAVEGSETEQTDQITDQMEKTEQTGNAAVSEFPAEVNDAVRLGQVESISLLSDSPAHDF
jgi:hypothetical protein